MSHMPKEGEGKYLCCKCNHSITFPALQGDKFVKPGGLFNRPKCPECGSQKFKRDIRIQY